MRWRTAALVLALAGLAGCSERPVAVSGAVKSKAGRPVTGVLLVLMPVGGPASKTRAFPLDDQGAFQGEAYPGTYTYYLSRLSVETDEDGIPVNKADVPKQKAHDKAYRVIPPAYRTHESAGPD